MFVREMLEHYEEPRPHFNTVSTTVRILEDKGFVAHEPVFRLTVITLWHNHPTSANAPLQKL